MGAKNRGTAEIFISYRRQDSLPQASRLSADLRRWYGRALVFLDTEDITGAQEFPARIQQELESSKVVLVVIGQNWLSIRDDGTKERRLDNPEDWVRKEVSGALNRPGVTVLPVLVSGAEMPNVRDLPNPLLNLPVAQACRMRESDWGRDFAMLLRAIRPAMRRRYAGPVGAASLGLAVTTLAAVALVLVRWAAPLYSPGDRSALMLASAACGFALIGGWSGLSGWNRWIVLLSKTAWRSAPGLVVLLAASALGYQYWRPVVLTLETQRFGEVDPCNQAYQYAPFPLERYDRLQEYWPDSVWKLPCKDAFKRTYQSVRIRTGLVARSGGAELGITTKPGYIATVLASRLDESDSFVRPEAPRETVKISIADLGRAADHVFWFTVESPTAAVDVTATLMVGRETLGSAQAQPSIPERPARPER